MVSLVSYDILSPISTMCPIGLNIENRKMNMISNHDESKHFGELRTVVLGDITLGQQIPWSYSTFKSQNIQPCHLEKALMG